MGCFAAGAQARTAPAYRALVARKVRAHVRAPSLEGDEDTLAGADMAEVDWRRVNIDQFDEDKLEPDQLYEKEDEGNASQVQQEVRQLISRGDSTSALIASLATSDPTATLSVLGTVKLAEISGILKALEDTQLDALMRAIYKGLAAPADNNCAILLSWHEKVVELGGEGVIVRVLCHRG